MLLKTKRTYTLPAMGTQCERPSVLRSCFRVLLSVVVSSFLSCFLVFISAFLSFIPSLQYEYYYCYFLLIAFFLSACLSVCLSCLRSFSLCFYVSGSFLSFFLCLLLSFLQNLVLSCFLSFCMPFLLDLPGFLHALHLRNQGPSPQKTKCHQKKKTNKNMSRSWVSAYQGLQTSFDNELVDSYSSLSPPISDWCFTEDRVSAFQDLYCCYLSLSTTY